MTDADRHVFTALADTLEAILDHAGHYVRPASHFGGPRDTCAACPVCAVLRAARVRLDAAGAGA